MTRRMIPVIVAALALLGVARPACAIFHISVIDEVSTSYNGDPNVQFIEMRMLAILQNFVTNSVFAAFDANGNYINDVLVVPGNVATGGNGVRWLVGTSGFQTASARRCHEMDQPLPLDLRDPDITRAKQLQRRDRRHGTVPKN